jgi:hypothetical protein
MNAWRGTSLLQGGERRFEGVGHAGREAVAVMKALQIIKLVKIHQLPLPPGEGWGEGVSNEPLPAHPCIF